MKNKLLYVHNANFNTHLANRVQVLSMCDAFYDNKVDISLMTFGNKKTIYNLYNFNNKIKFILFKPIENYYFRTIILFFNFFFKLRKNFDKVFTRDLLFAYLVSIFTKKRVIYELHQILENKIWLYLLKKIQNNTPCIVVISEGIKDKLIEFGFNNSKIKVLHDGVDLKKFDIDISKIEARKKLKLNSKKHIVSYVGNTQIERDLDTFIKVAKILPNVDFLVYGKPQKYLEVASKKITNFYFLGYNKNPQIIYKASDILFAGFTSKISTINYMSPLKIFEYMASKKPFIVADFQRVRDIISEEECYFYKSEDIFDLKNKIEFILNNFKLSLIKSIKSYKLVKTCFTWRQRANLILDLFIK